MQGTPCMGLGNFGLFFSVLVLWLILIAFLAVLSLCFVLGSFPTVLGRCFVLGAFLAVLDRCFFVLGALPPYPICRTEKQSV